jgi:hypothetical protein
MGEIKKRSRQNPGPTPACPTYPKERKQGKSLYNSLAGNLPRSLFFGGGSFRAFAVFWENRSLKGITIRFCAKNESVLEAIIKIKSPKNQFQERFSQ